VSGGETAGSTARKWLNALQNVHEERQALKQVKHFERASLIYSHDQPMIVGAQALAPCKAHVPHRKPQPEYKTDFTFQQGYGVQPHDGTCMAYLWKSGKKLEHADHSNTGITLALQLGEQPANHSTIAELL
jgi:hypothetical protein